MSISVTCTCGKRFQAKDALAGKRVKCPACGGPLAIPRVEAEDSDRVRIPDPNRITVECGCGKTFHVKPELIGKRARCSACGAILVIGSSDYRGAYKVSEPEPAPPPPTVKQRVQVVQEDEEEEEEEEKPTPRQRKKSKITERQTQAPSGSGFREYAYALLIVALVPLGFSLTLHDDVSVKQQIERTLSQLSPEQREQILARIANDDSKDDFDLLQVLPNRRLAGAHLSAGSWIHWLYAFLAAGCYLGFLLLLFRSGSANTTHLLVSAIFTATIGIVLLLVVQFLATHFRFIGIPRSIVGIIFFILQVIGWSYRSALDPDSNFIASFFGFTFGVGLCEELCKALPLLFYLRNRNKFSWRQACMWGLASGVGFGIAEGVMYSSQYYNGIAGFDLYLVRFVSCVALHAMWSATVGLLLYSSQAHFEGSMSWPEWGLGLIRILIVPMILHGLYDTFLKKEMHLAALVVSLLSFGVLAFMVELVRRQEADTEEEDEEEEYRRAMGY